MCRSHQSNAVGAVESPSDIYTQPTSLVFGFNKQILKNVFPFYGNANVASVSPIKSHHHQIVFKYQLIIDGCTGRKIRYQTKPKKLVYHVIYATCTLGSSTANIFTAFQHSINAHTSASNVYHLHMSRSRVRSVYSLFFVISTVCEHVHLIRLARLSIN